MASDGGRAAAVDAEIVIVGAGIAGLATAVALRRLGMARGLTVLERHGELRATGAAITLFPNGWFALRTLGVAHKLTSRYSVDIRNQVTNLETGSTKEFRFSGHKHRYYRLADDLGYKIVWYMSSHRAG